MHILGQNNYVCVLGTFSTLEISVIVGLFTCMEDILFCTCHHCKRLSINGRSLPVCMKGGDVTTAAKSDVHDDAGSSDPDTYGL